MEIIRTADFERAFRAIPKEIKRLYLIQEDRFRENWRDPRLHIKKIKSLEASVEKRWHLLQEKISFCIG